ncbi:hypothetical protein B0H11DRAFT_1907735 [Mycena galericulata]|nr:hypothetical protein B0H11DRAFT_1907735 [Mycena galericulata]
MLLRIPAADLRLWYGDVWTWMVDGKNSGGDRPKIDPVLTQSDSGGVLMLFHDTWNCGNPSTSLKSTPMFGIYRGRLKPESFLNSEHLLDAWDGVLEGFIIEVLRILRHSPTGYEQLRILPGPDIQGLKGTSGAWRSALLFLFGVLLQQSSHPVRFKTGHLLT